MYLVGGSVIYINKHFIIHPLWPTDSGKALVNNYYYLNLWWPIFVDFQFLGDSLGCYSLDFLLHTMNKHCVSQLFHWGYWIMGKRFQWNWAPTNINGPTGKVQNSSSQTMCSWVTPTELLTITRRLMIEYHIHCVLDTLPSLTRWWVLCMTF